jgi:hypothetical protein
MSIADRIDAAFEKAAWRFPESRPKVVYLTDADWAELDAAMSEEWGSNMRLFTYRNLDIRRGRRSQVITDRGCAVCVPRVLSPRVRQAA